MSLTTALPQGILTGASNLGLNAASTAASINGVQVQRPDKTVKWVFEVTEATNGFVVQAYDGGPPTAFGMASVAEVTIAAKLEDVQDYVVQFITSSRLKRG
jgi:hypothetical protein